MRRKSAGKKLMAVLIAASLALTPAELTVAAEMEPEGEEAAFLAEESGDTASSDPEDTAETETEITDGSAATEEQETTDTDKPDTGNNVQENAETGAMESGEEAPEGTAEEEDPETPEAAMDAAEALEECEQEEENAAFDDGTKDAVQASAEYSDGKFTWVLDGNGTLTITGNNMELTKNEISESALEKAGIDFSRVNKLVIGNGITGFDRWGMWNLKKYIKELEIHGNAGMNMPEQCFYDVPNIESVVISGAVDVPRDMFGKCTELKKVTLKNGVRSIGEDAFRDCSSLESVIFENTVLEKISDGAFWGCSALSSIALPDSVTEIERNAFFETGLRNIQLPEKLTLIGGGAFCNCKNLKQVQLPPQLKELGEGAFFNCENLAQIQLPSQLNKLGGDAFRDCTSLDKIDIPAGLKQIESATFCNTGLTSVTLHEGLTKIEDWAFHDCLKLKKIRIPKSVTDIGELALGIRYNMGNGAEEVIPGGFTVEGYTGSAAERYVKRMHQSENLYHVFFKDVKFVSIGGQTAAVTNISKTKISALKTRAFTGKPLTQALTITYGGKKLVNGRDYTLTWKNNKNIGTASVTIKGKGKYNGSVTKKFRITVQKNAVYTVSRLKYKISSADTSGKGTVVFTGATDKAARKALTIPTTVKIGGKSFRVTAIGTSAMSGAKKLTTVKIGANIMTVGAKAFYGCSKLSNVTIFGTKLTTAKTGANAFKGIRSNCRFKVPASRVSAYKKLLRAKGAGPKIIVTK
ncbi:leucine-rich repeat domain-containing protein [Blautia massiliensis (ex Durand et al. 2017)]|uniref:leucine-rich repeat domain-containing protein n=1 Tax=Blautia massiliensis (ex Durand et al. 2017) TaxID=1737424 RepID=UPI00189BF829|nr:leucine-rich repeat domain-containing protein [Blautia massiliensis (ex Durand et al. 2017)]